MSSHELVPTLAVLAALLAAPIAHATAAGTASKAPKASAAMKAPATAKPAAVPRVDLNTATRDELVKQPGIGEAIADKIIAARPFTSKSELVSKGIVTKAEFAKLAPHVIAKQSPETAKPAHRTAKSAARPAPRPSK